MVVGEVQPHRDPRPERRGRLELEAARPRRRARCPASTASTCALSGTPMLPPTSTCRPAALSIRPISVVVVDFPFVPVMAMTRPCSQRDASSSSPMISTPRCARRVEHRLLERHARARHDQVGRRERRRADGRPVSSVDAGRPQAVGAVERRARLGQRHARAPPRAAAPPRRCRCARRRPPPPGVRRPRSRRCHAITAASTSSG